MDPCWRIIADVIQCLLRVFACGLLVLGTSCPRTARSGDPVEPKALLEAAQKADRIGRLATAERLWVQVLRGARERGEDALRFRATLALARVSQARGRLAVGQAVLGQELARAKKAGNRSRMAQAHAAMGELHCRSGRLDLAVRQYKRAQRVAKAAGMRSLRAQVIARLAGVAARRGELESAVKAMTQVVALVGGLRSLPAARAALAAGRGFALLADYRRARRYLGIAQMGFGAKGRLARSGVANLELARLAVTVGDREAAKRDFGQALGQLAKAGALRRHANAANHFARALDSWGAYGSARRQRKTARRSLRALGDDYGEALVDLDAARVLQRRGLYRDSATLLRRAVVVLEKASDRFSSGEARILMGRARVQMGRAAEGLGELTRALDHASAVSAPELSWRAYALLGFLSDTLLDRESNAARFHKGAVNALERVRTGLDLIGGSDAATEDNAYYELSRVYVKQWRRGGDPAHLDAALASLERSRARRLLDLLTRSGASLADSGQDRRRVRGLSGEERFVAEQLAEPGVGLSLRRLLYKRLIWIRSARTQLEGKAFRFAAAHPAPVSVGILKGAISEKGAVLIYHVGQRSSLLYGFNNEQATVVNLPGQEELRKLVRGFTGALFGTGDQSVAEVRRRGARLVRRLIAPVAKILTGRSRVHLVLSGPLWRLPFAALPEGKRGWLGERRVFVRIPSPAVWLKLKATPRGKDAKRELLAVARVSGDAQGVASPVRAALIARGHRLATLAGSRARAARVVAAVGSGRATIVSGSRGSESAFRKRVLTDYRRLHFAARLLLPARILGPSQPALVLAGDGGSDGLLLLREIMGLRLDADFVSIEGLDLGRGAPDWQGQEAVARALLLAGVRSVALPLAPAAPATADRFFSTCYRSLVKGSDKGTAWIAAGRAVRNHRATRHPKHWATYVLYGAL
jgi:CHAT domain-containing protein/tetratricopeptide (TPR) repeat protein